MVDITERLWSRWDYQNKRNPLIFLNRISGFFMSSHGILRPIVNIVNTLILFCIMFFLTGCATNPRPWTKTEKGLLVSSIFASAADCYTTERMLDRGFTEINPVLGPHPTDGKTVRYFIGTKTLEIIVAHYWEDARPWILGGATAVYGSAAIHNDSLED